MSNVSYEDYQEMISKKEKKSKKKELKRAKKKLKELAAVATMGDNVVEIKKEAPVYAPFTDDEKKQFAIRIQNEKRNIWKMNLQDPEKIIQFCGNNVADEKNAAIRFARRDALKWAKAQQPMPY